YSSEILYVRTAFTTGHLAQWLGATCNNGGSSAAHSATLDSQRGSNGHPGGRACSGGTAPSIVRSGRERSVLKVGMACSRPRVYGCAGDAKMSAFDPSSTRLPAYVTA